MKQERDEFLATAEMYEHFIERNVIWKDMKMVIEAWIEDCKTALSDPNQVNSLEALADFQGRIYMCERFLAFPQEAIEALKVEKEKQDVSTI